MGYRIRRAPFRAHFVAGRGRAVDIFYLRAKGKAEKKIAALKYESLQIARLPAIKSEREQVRIGELFTIWLFGLLPKFILTNYRPMSAKDIASAVIAAAQTEAKGVQIYHPRDFAQTRGK